MAPLPDEPIKASFSYKNPPKLTWMFYMPGLTGDLFLEACNNNGLFVNGQIVNLDSSQWAKLEVYCRDKLGLTSDWQDISYAELVQKAKDNGWMKTYGPNPIINKRKLKEDKDIKSKTVIESVEQRGLF